MKHVCGVYLQILIVPSGTEAHVSQSSTLYSRRPPAGPFAFMRVERDMKKRPDRKVRARFGLRALQYPAAPYAGSFRAADGEHVSHLPAQVLEELTLFFFTHDSVVPGVMCWSLFARVSRW